MTDSFQTPTRIRWTQFTLRTLLLSFLVVAVVLVIYRQPSAVRRVEAMGGEILFDYEYRIYNPRGGPRQFPSDPERAATSTVTGVNFDGKPLTNADLVHFVRISRNNLPKIERLSIRRTQVTDVRPLTRMAQLKWLDISGISAEDVSPLKSLSNLGVLYMKNAHASPATIDELKKALPRCAIYHDG